VKPSEFSAATPGRLISVGSGAAFVPDPLPPELTSTWPLAEKVDQAGRALARLDGQASRIPNKNFVIRPLVTREAMESARLEGTHTVVARVLLQEAVGPVDDPYESQSNQEVINYLGALADGQQWIAEGRPVTTQTIRGFHATLLNGTRGASKNPGQFRTTQVAIGTEGDDIESARFVPAPPEFVIDLMENWQAFLDKYSPYPPLIAAGIAHYQI
jgi:Fic family protein